MKILLTFTGFHDPYSLGLVGEEEQPGPIVSLVGARSFDKVFLLSTPATLGHTERTRDALEQSHQEMAVEILDVPLDDPTDYQAIIRELREKIPPILKKYPDAEFAISVASGTPQMHASWVLLTASGEIPAQILHVRPPRFVTKDRPQVSEIQLTPDDSDVSAMLRVVERLASPPEDLAFPPKMELRAPRAEAPEPPFTADLDKIVAQLGIVGEHSTFRNAIEITDQLAGSDFPLLVLGETGTGKELFAKLAHRLSGRPGDRFVTLSSPNIPHELVESMLFGHKKGAFTGAVSDQKGKFEQADGGTLFLDEIGELPLPTQAKLLRVLQDGIIEPLGSTEARQVDVRIVAATNRDLPEEIKEGNFREDLYYRLRGGEIRLPALRERRSDIGKLALHILERVNASLRYPKRLTQEALSRMEGYIWPGNVRELQFVIERSARLARKALLDADDIVMDVPVSGPDPYASLPEPHDGFSMNDYLKSVRKQLMLRALAVTNGNQSQAAKLLGITAQAVHNFIKDEGGD
jgi:transcriptional regulator with GAF, ATPase, and Fis domain